MSVDFSPSMKWMNRGTEKEALEKIRGEIQFHMEYCLCSGLRSGETIGFSKW